MRIKISIIRVALLALLMYSTAAEAQTNSYSPYSLYGLGDLSAQGPGNLRSMGGAGTGYRRTETNGYTLSLNYLNPASYSGMMREKFMFNVGLEGQSFLLRQDDLKSSYSTFNIRDIGVMFPIARGVGFAVTVTPFSSAGYRLEELVENNMGSIGSAVKYYEGDGDITQVKAGLGIQLNRKLSLGAEMVYLKGLIERTQEVYFNNELGESGLTNMYSSMTEDISRFTVLAGVQYNAISTLKRSLTFGATYRMGIKLRPKLEHYVPATANDPDPVYENWSTGKMELPDEFSFGFYYHTLKWSIGADYVYTNWGSRNDGIGGKAGDIRMEYANASGFRAGAQFTPQFADIRSFFKRLSYRVGVRYQQGYMKFAGERIDEKAVTFGVGMPLKYGYITGFDFGFEYGQRGTTTKGLVKSDYIKFSLGFKLFSERDFWFMKKKYD